MRYFSSKLQGCLGFVALALTVIVGVNGCSWDQSVFDIFVSDDKVEACKGLKQINLKIGDKIIECKSNSNDENCLKYADAFEYEICPGGYSCNGKICEPPAVKGCSKDSDCIDPNAKSATCENRECKFECKESYKLIANTCQLALNCGENQHAYSYEENGKTNAICEKDDDNNCGSHGNKCSELVGWEEGGCTNGKCVATKCATGYKEKDGVCSALTGCPIEQYYHAGSCYDNDINNCGGYNYNCAVVITGWLDGECKLSECENGEACEPVKCVATKCQDGFHLGNGSNGGEFGTCVPDKNECCGEYCEKCGSGQVCSMGECSSNCGNNLTLCTDQCANINSDMNHCGGCGNVCSSSMVSNSDEAVCSDGNCIAKSCHIGFHLYNNTCEADSEMNCGAHDNNCAQVINGWDSGECEVTSESVQCVAKTCQSGYHIYGDTCEADTNSVCGSERKACTGSTMCANGVCSSGCGALTLCGNACANVNNDMANCGECGKECNTEKVSNSTQVFCQNKICKASGCETGFHLHEGKCEVNDNKNCGAHDVKCNIENAENVCLNGQCRFTCKENFHTYKKDNVDSCEADSPSNCGYHGNTCSSAEGWDGGNCTGGKCIASKCKANYCLKDGVCYNGTYNSLACGISGNCSNCDTKSTNKACFSGQCILSQCSNKVCFYEAKTCDNTNEHCGPTCTNCNTANKAFSGTCNAEAGTCTITSCRAGYRLKDGECIANSTESCGVSQEVNANSVVNCLTDNTYSDDGKGVKEAICNDNAKCTVTQCNANYHMTENKCVKDSPSACGPSATNCLDDGTKTATCENGICKASECNANYCLSGNKCISGTSNSAACGIQGGTNACIPCGTGMACVNGECKQSSCASHLCFHNGTECKNDDTYCGSTCTDCTSSNHAAEGVCEVNDGVASCKITKCAVGYYLSNNKCVKNTNSACGSATTNCTDATKGIKYGICNIDGNCVISSCLGSHHQHETDNVISCELNDINNCGQHDRKCNVSNASNTCDSITCTFSCDTGYHLNASGNGCAQDTVDNCGAENYKCADRMKGWRNGTCPSGVCLASACDSNNYGLDEQTHLCYSLTESIFSCGASHTDCTAIPNINSKNTNGVSCVKSGSEYICNVLKCATGYHLATDLKTCIQNTDKLCGKQDESTTTDCTSSTTYPHTSNGVCQLDGTCGGFACAPGYKKDQNGACNACDTGYFEKNNECVSASKTSCFNDGDCTKKEGWSDASCDRTKEKCSAITCKPGYNIKKNNDDTYTCVEEDASSCGGAACSVARVPGSESNPNNCPDQQCYTCQSGVCKATTCASGYHLYEGSCEGNSNVNCGAHDAACPGGMAGVTSGYCSTTGTCIHTGCANNYTLVNGVCTSTEGCDLSSNHLNGAVCEPNDNNNCGSHGNACSSDSKGTKSCTNAGVCRYTECAESYHMELTDGVQNCVANSDTKCGASKSSVGTVYNCSEPTYSMVNSKHSSTLSCNVSMGVCYPTACLNEYHLDNNECVKHTDAACGSSPVDCSSQQIGNATTKKCNISTGTCYAYACAEGYHVYNDACEPDTTNNCGGHDKKCAAPSNGTITCVPSAAGQNNGSCSSANCNAGYYTLENVACAPCSKGTYAANQGSTACTNCPAGSYSANDAASSCTPCSGDTVAQNAGSTGCTACPNGTVANEAHTQCVASSSDECSSDTECSSKPNKVCDTTANPKVCVECMTGKLNFCTPPDNATATCTNNTCGFTCDQNYHKSGNACVLDTHDACGIAAAQCGVAEQCVGGKCFACTCTGTCSEGTTCKWVTDQCTCA